MNRPMKISMKILASALLLPAFLGAGELTDAEFERLKTQTLAKERHVIFNNDGCDMTEYKGKDTSIEAITDYWLSPMKNSAVDVVSYCPFSVGLQLATRATAAEIHVGKPAGKGSTNLTPILLSRGTDPLQIAVDFCRQNKLEIFACLRVNDVHDSFRPFWLSSTKKTHPEWLCGSFKKCPPYGKWSSFDFARPEVRKMVRDIAFELMLDYDVDGIELDFMRFPCFFKSVAWGGTASPQEVESMTQLMRDIRKDADWIGRRKGRYLMIAARMPDSSALGKAIGVDIENILKEKLIDIFIPGADFVKVNFFADAARLAKKHGVKAFTSIDKSWVKAQGEFARNSNMALNAQSAAALAGGADGTYYFNIVYHLNHVPYIKRTLQEMKGVSKRYFSYYHRLEKHFTCEDMENFSPALPYRGDNLFITPGVAAKAIIEVGDDFTDPDVIALSPSVRLLIDSQQMSQPPFRTVVNGRDAGLPERRNDRYEYQLPPEMIKRGKNEIIFLNNGNFQQDKLCILKGDVLLRGAKQGPWRRLFPSEFPRCEEIVDKSYRIYDESSCEFANLLYPLPAFKGTLSGSFEMMLEKTTAKDGVVFRVADGKYAELVSFMPDKITLLYNGRSVAFDTTKKFHAYHFKFEKGKFLFSADGRELFNLPCTTPATAQKAKMRGNNFNTPNMNTRSLLIGSLSAEGKGSARWKNFCVDFPGYTIRDIALAVDFPTQFSPRLVKASSMKFHPLAEMDAAKGSRALEGWKNQYKKNFFRFSQGKLMLDNRDPQNAGASITLLNQKVLQGEPGIFVVEVEAGDLKTSNGKNECLAVGLRLPVKDSRRVYDAHFRLAPGSLSSPIGNIQIPNGAVKIKMAIDTSTGRALISVNGKPMAEGLFGTNLRTPSFYFGDTSPAHVAGQNSVKLIRLGRVQP